MYSFLNFQREMTRNEQPMKKQDATANVCFIFLNKIRILLCCGLIYVPPRDMVRSKLQVPDLELGSLLIESSHSGMGLDEGGP